MRAVDLLSREAKPRSRPPAWGALAILVLAFAVGAFLSAVVYVRADARASRNDERLVEMRRQLALAQAARQPVAAPKGPNPMLELRSATLATLEGREGWGGLLRGMGRVMPSGAWLTKLSLTQPGVNIEAGGGSPTTVAPPAPAPAPAEAQAAAPTAASAAAGVAPGEVALSLVGCALGQGQVGQAASGVNLLPGASGVSVSSAQAGQAQGSACGGHSSFQLSFNISGGTS